MNIGNKGMYSNYECLILNSAVMTWPHCVDAQLLCTTQWPIGSTVNVTHTHRIILERNELSEYALISSTETIVTPLTTMKRLTIQ